MSEDVERERQALLNAINNVSPPIELAYSHPATVQTQDVNGRVSVVLDNGGPLPGASDVDDVYGMPGVRCKVPQGTRGRVGFDNGNPCKRTFGTYDAGCPVTEISIASPLPGQDVARKGDTTSSGRLSWEQLPLVNGIPVGGILTHTYPIPPGSTDIGVRQWLITGPIVITQVFPPSASPQLDLTGIITSGSTIVKIGG